MSKTLSRRSLLASLATAPAIAAPTTVISYVSTGATADPIIAAVIEHKGAFLMMESWYSGAYVECDDDDPEGVTEDEVLERHYNAFDRLFTTRATTVAGVEFWLRHIASPGYSLGTEDSTIIGNLSNFRDPFRETAISQMLRMAAVLRENA